MATPMRDRDGVPASSRHQPLHQNTGGRLRRAERRASAAASVAASSSSSTSSPPLCSASSLPPSHNATAPQAVWRRNALKQRSAQQLGDVKSIDDSTASSVGSQVAARPHVLPSSPASSSSLLSRIESAPSAREFLSPRASDPSAVAMIGASLMAAGVVPPHPPRFGTSRARDSTTTTLFARDAQ